MTATQPFAGNDTLATLTLLPPAAPPLAVQVPGTAPLPFETLLRGRGLNPLADRLVAATAQADAAMGAADPHQAAGVRAAAQALAALGTLVQDELAPALDERMGFSDADGD